MKKSAHTRRQTLKYHNFHFFSRQLRPIRYDVFYTFNRYALDFVSNKRTPRTLPNCISAHDYRKSICSLKTQSIDIFYLYSNRKITLIVININWWKRLLKDLLWVFSLYRFVNSHVIYYSPLAPAIPVVFAVYNIACKKQHKMYSSTHPVQNEREKTKNSCNL